MSQKAEEFFGRKREEVIGKNVKLLMPSPFSENHDSYVANYMNTGLTLSPTWTSGLYINCRCVQCVACVCVCVCVCAGEAKIIGVGRDVVALLKDGSMCPIHLAVTEVLFV